ncbi:F-actin-uncapping protein LRRC16A-like isoform X2 [Lytechinus variegatus]|uniref:F-actin-uncapping protein LRRC16A-like isoform X2 n=1 Tax=Lytechinus variegatus TaxID=7654 RepID=UPI001BB1D33E|nr:F-actin-uncapping protein LRRC16A-like isoform X2 [Lytechinus variegatus]
MTSTSEIPAEILAGVKQALGKNYEHGPIKLVKMNKGTEQEDRVLALTQYRTYVLLCAARTRVEFKFNHLQIDSLESNKPLKLKFGFPKERDRDKSLSFTMKSINDTLDVIEFILKSLQRVFPLTSTDKLIREIHMEPPERRSHIEARLNRSSMVEQGPCGGFSHMYRFMCDYFDLPYLAEVAWDVDTIYLSQDCKELRINDFDDLEPKHMLPIIAVLNYNTWFTHLTVVNYKLTSEALKEIPKVIRSSHTLESLTLDGVGLKWDFLQEMSLSLTANSQSNLRSINLSNNPVDDRGIRHLCGPLQKMTHGLVELRLVKTGMTAEGASHLGKALGENNFIPTTLKVLDLSGNAFKDAQHGLQNIIGNISRNAKPWPDPSIHNLYNFLYQSNAITHLNLADTDCSLNHIFEALHKGCFLSLVHLNLSGTFAHSKHHSVVPRQVKNFFTAAKSLKTINISRNRCPPALVKEILETIGFNKDLNRLEIDLSSNELGQEGADAVSSCISMLNNVTTLNLRDNGFNVAMVSLVAWMGQNHSLECIDLSQNMSPSSKKADREKVVVALEEMIQNPDLPLHTILLAGNRFRLETQQLINALGSNTTLLSVDLSGNEMKDIGARLLAKALQINNKLQTVVIDNNNIGLQGFQDLAQALERNYTLKRMPIPTTDMMAAMQKNHEKHEKTEAAIQKIQECLQRNHSPRKFSNKQAFLLQRGFLYTTAHQMVDKLVVHIEDMATELTQKSDADLQEKISTARGLIDDANNSKKIYDVLQNVVGRSDDEDLTEKLREIACLIESEMEARLERNANGMVDGTSQLCGYVMQDRCLYEKIEDTCREHYRLPPRFVEDLVDQISAETSNQCSEANLAMASFISDSILDEIIEQLSTVEAELSDELKKFRDEVANGTTVRQVESIFEDSREEEEEEEDDSKEEQEEENDEEKTEEGQVQNEEKENVEIKIEDEGSADGSDTNEVALQNGGTEVSKTDDDAGASSGGQALPVASLPQMTKKQNIRVQRAKSVKRPVSELPTGIPVIPIDIEEDKPEERPSLSPLPDVQLPDLPDPNQSAKEETDSSKSFSTPRSKPKPSLLKPPSKSPGSTPKLVEFESVSNQAAAPLRDVRADRPRVSRAMRPARARPAPRPSDQNPEGIIEEEDDLSKMWSSPTVPGFETQESPSSSPSGSQTSLSESKKSEKKNFLGGLFRRKKDEKKDSKKDSDKKDSKKDKKETKKEKKEREDREKKEKEERERKEKEQKEKSKKSKTPLTPTSYKSEPVIDDIDRVSKAEPTTPRFDLSPAQDTPSDVGAEKEKTDSTEAPSKHDTTEDQPKDKIEELTPVAPPKKALRPVTGVSMFGADVMQQMQQRRMFKSANNEDVKETPEPKSPTTAPKPAFRSSPPSSEKVTHKPLVLPTSPSKSLSSPNPSPAASPLSPKATSPGPTSPRPASTSPKPVPALRPVPKPRKSELPTGADTKPLVKEVKEEEEKGKGTEEVARAGSAKSTSAVVQEKTEADAAKVDSKEQPPAAEEDTKPLEEAVAAKKTKSESDEDASAEKKQVEESVQDQAKNKEEDKKLEDSSKTSEEKEVVAKEKPQKVEDSPAVSLDGDKNAESDKTKGPESTPEDSLVRTGSTSSEKSSPLISSGSLKDVEKTTEPVIAPKKDSIKSPSLPISPKSIGTDGSPKRLSSKPKPAVPLSTKPRPASISKKPVLPPPKPDGSIADHRRSLKPVTARKPEAKERTSLIGLHNSGPKESNGESTESIPPKPSDLKRASKTSINGQTPKESNKTAVTPVEEEKDETPKEKEAIFV